MDHQDQGGFGVGVVAVLAAEAYGVRSGVCVAGIVINSPVQAAKGIVDGGVILASIGDAPDKMSLQMELEHAYLFSHFFRRSTIPSIHKSRAS